MNLLSMSEEQRLRLLVNAVTDYAIYMLDPQGHIATWNPGAERFKGYVADEIIGEHFSRFFTADDIAAGLPDRALRLAVAEGRFESEGWRVRKDGSRFWVNAVIDPIFDDSGELLGFAKITRDISEQKKAQEELEAAREALHQSQKLQALGELTGGVAHDFNNLLTVISGASDFLQRNPGLDEGKRRKYLDAISETANRATELTSHLLAFGRRQPIRPVVIDLNARLDAFAELTARMLTSKIEVRLELHAKSSLTEVDPVQLETALLNAAINARDAMPGGGQLLIRTEDCEHEGDPAICIFLRDSGTGIPADKLQRVFEPFFTTKEVGKGTGLGLSQIHGFAAQAGGIAAIESEEGKGTTLKIVLPATRKTLQLVTSDTSEAKLPEGFSVLLVEDNDQVRQFAATLLRDLGCSVAEASNAKDALARMDEQRFDLVFSDVVMPGISGIELAMQLAERGDSPPVLLASGYNDKYPIEDTHDFTVIRKPYDARSLGRAMSDLHRDSSDDGRKKAGRE